MNECGGDQKIPLIFFFRIVLLLLLHSSSFFIPLFQVLLKREQLLIQAERASIARLFEDIQVLENPLS